MLRRCSPFVSLLMALVLTLPLAACSASGKTVDKVTLQLNWYNAAEFIGYYMADAKGFYSDSNLAVTIKEVGTGKPAWQSILDGQADFAVGTFDEQKKLVEGNQPSVAVLTVFQIPPLVMFALSDSGIKEPGDLIGKRIGIKSDYWRGVERQTLTNAGIDPSKVVEVDVKSDAQSMLYEGKVDVWMGYAHDEPVLAHVAGYRVTNIYPADYGVGGYEGLLLVNQNTTEQQADMVGRFVRASQKGLQYAMEHPDEAAQIMVTKQPKESLEFYKLAVRALIPLVDIPQSKIGMIDPVRWASLMGASYDVRDPGYSMQFFDSK